MTQINRKRTKEITSILREEQAVDDVLLQVRKGTTFSGQFSAFPHTWATDVGKRVWVIVEH